MKRPCLCGCGKAVEPYDDKTLTSLEFTHLKAEPDKVPKAWEKSFKEQLLWEKRHLAGMRGAKTRRERKTS